MKVSRDGPVPQLELGPHIGGMKVLYQRAGSLLFQPVTMIGAMFGAWGTNPGIRALFQNSLILYFGSVTLAGVFVMMGYYMAVLPSEQSFNQGQSQRAERSPLKRDTETIREQLEVLNEQLSDEGLEKQLRRVDGGEGVE